MKAGVVPEGPATPVVGVVGRGLRVLDAGDVDREVGAGRPQRVH